MPAFESPVRMAFTRKADGIYGIEVPLLSTDVSGRNVKCRHTLKFKRNQLRQDVRVETDFTIGIRRIASESAPDRSALDTSSFMVKMTDLSGGGCSFITERRLSIGDTIVVTAASPKLTLPGIRAKVIAFSQQRASPSFRYHAQFVNIDFEKKETIVRYVFARMREMNQR